MTVAIEKESELRQAYEQTSLGWQSAHLKIINKKAQLVPFVHNKAQLKVHNVMALQQKYGLPIKIIILKARKRGISTYIEACIFEKINRRENVHGCVVSMDKVSTNKVFKMAETFQEEMPTDRKIKTERSNRQEILYASPHRGSLLCQTAGTTTLGRGGDTHYVHACLSEKTPIISNTGLCLMSDYEVGDDVITHTGKQSKVSVKSRQVKDCVKAIFKGLQGFPFIATPDHKIWSKKGWQKLRDMKIGDCIGFPVRPITEKIASLPFDVGVKYRKHGGGRIESVPAQVPLTYELGLLVGLYLAEGHLKLQHNKKRPNPCGVAFCVHKKEVNRTVLWLSGFSSLYKSSKISYRKNSLAAKVNVYGRSFAEFFNNLCGRVKSKHFPIQWYDYPKDFVKGIVYGYLDGDGHFYKDTRRIVAPSIHSAITVGMREALASLGYGWPSIEHKPSALRRGRNEKEQFRLSLCGGGVEIISKDLGKSYLLRKRKDIGHFGTVQVEKGYAWIPLLSIVNVASPCIVNDFTVDDKDHSYCTIHGAVSNTEVPYWKNADNQLTGLLNEVPSNDPDTMVVIEGTANGTGGHFFKEYWAAVDRLRGLYNKDGSINPTALAGFVPVFLSWQDEEEYQTALPKGCKTIPENLMTDEIKAYVAEGLEMGIELSQEQLYYAILTIQNNCGGDISRFKAEYPRTARESFQSTGRMVFKPTDLDWMEKSCKPAIDHIEFYYDNITQKIKYRRVDREVNCWSVWRYPQEGHSYICFGDVAEGVLSDQNDSRSDPDRSVAAILDRGEYDVPMTYYGRPDTIEYGDQMLYASVFFNYAWASPEMNSIGQSVLDTFKRAEYEFIYVRSRGEQTNNPEDSDLLGWKTTVLTKKPMIADLQKVVSEHGLRVYDIRFVDELRVFIWNPQGKPMAEKSEHDDCVITLAGLIQLHQRCQLNEDFSFAEDLKTGKNEIAVMGAIDYDTDDNNGDLDGLYEDGTERLEIGIDDDDIGELG